MKLKTLKEAEELVARLLDFSGSPKKNTDTGEAFEASVTIQTPSSRPSTRTNLVTPSSFTTQQTDFLDVNVRSNRKCLNESLVRCFVQYVADFKVSHNDLVGI